MQTIAHRPSPTLVDLVVRRIKSLSVGIAIDKVPESRHILRFLLAVCSFSDVSVTAKHPSGPVAFWAFRNIIDNTNTLVVAKYADVTLRNALGMTMLHSIIIKEQWDLKIEILEMLLVRGVDVSARDFEGNTARDYVLIHRVGTGTALSNTG